MRPKSLFLSISLLAFSFFINGQTYQGTQPGKVLRKWYVVGPIRVSADTAKTPGLADQEQFFNRVDDTKLNVSFKVPQGGIPDITKWKKIEAWSDNVDFDSIFNRPDFVSAYAYAVIVSDAARPAVYPSHHPAKYGSTLWSDSSA